MNRLFVIMPFGQRVVSFAASSTLDFDRVYRDLIRPAAVQAGWDVLRIDEVTLPGNIGDQYLREIYLADLVLADISVPNGNVYYELGIRQAIASGGTLLIAMAGAVVPFDLAGQRVLFYDEEPSKWIGAFSQIVDSLRGYNVAAQANPIRLFLEKIAASASPTQDRASFERELRERIERARTLDQLVAVCLWLRNVPNVPVEPLLALADRLAEVEEWKFAIEVLRNAAERNPRDYEVHRKLGWCLQFAGPGFGEESQKELEEALRLNPDDPETLGMMGGRAKRLGNYAAAAALYARGARVSPNSTYMLVNQAALAILADPAHPDLGIRLYQKLLAALEATSAGGADEWAEILTAEAFFAIGDLAKAEQHYLAGKAVATSPKSIGSAIRQLQAFAEVGFRAEDATLLVGLLKKGPERREAPHGSEAIQLSPSLAVGGGDSQRAMAAPIFLHLSDIHFGSLTKDDKPYSMHRFYDGENSQPLVKHLEEEFARPGSHFSFPSEQLQLVVSGDLVYTGSENEYKDVLDFLVKAVETLQVDRRNVHVVPGNHDISWNLARHDAKYRFDPYLALLFEFYGLDLVREKYPLISWPVSLNKRPAAHEIVSISHHPKSNLLVVGMNSCIYESQQDHYGFVGERQLKNIRELIASVRPAPGTLRAAVVHHHLLPFPESLRERPGEEIWTDVSTIRDAGLVERSLERLGFDLVLHGHKHKPQLRETLVQDADPSKGRLGRLIVAGAGTASCTELESGVSNHYEVIEVQSERRSFGTEFLRVEWRVLPLEAGAEWQTAKVWSILG
jgi:3',5'-cyclic AMP phosphodiesterase CpdA/cytochrome c-type biogenesis protein CcmH/NrfG